MNEDLQALICNILNESKDSERVEKLLDFLTQSGVKNVDDLSYVDKNSLRSLGILSSDEIKKILNKTWRMKLDEALQEIFKGGKEEKIQVIHECLQKGGTVIAEDLKYFDWESLRDMKVLSDMEIEKIMLFSKNNFPEEYEEHKDKYDKQKKLRMETELAVKRAEGESEILKLKTLGFDKKIEFNDSSQESGVKGEKEDKIPIHSVGTGSSKDRKHEDRSGPARPSFIESYKNHLKKYMVTMLITLASSYGISRISAYKTSFQVRVSMVLAGDFMLFCLERYCTRCS